MTDHPGPHCRCISEADVLRAQVEETAKECGVQKTENERLQALMTELSEQADFLPLWVMAIVNRAADRPRAPDPTGRIQSASEASNDH